MPEKLEVSGRDDEKEHVVRDESAFRERGRLAAFIFQPTFQVNKQLESVPQSLHTSTSPTGAAQEM